MWNHSMNYISHLTQYTFSDLAVTFMHFTQFLQNEKVSNVSNDVKPINVQQCWELHVKGDLVDFIKERHHLNDF